MADRYYVNFPLTPGRVVLQGPEAHHLATVLRAKPGDAVSLFNGDGAEYPATVESAASKSVVLSVAQPLRPERELAFSLEVAVAMPKGDRGDFVVEKLTELGTTVLSPIIAERSVARPKLERLQRAVIEASKQCGRNRLMQVTDGIEWMSYCRSNELAALSLVAHPHADKNLAGVLQGKPKAIRVAVGPEGGFTDEEISVAESEGWVSVSLGPRVLRVETAAIAIAAILSTA